MGVYVHVPFCPHVCPYCDFVKTSRFSKAGTSAFFASALTQLDALLPRYLAWARGATTAEARQSAPAPATTVYFGGGTPGLFDASAFAPIVERVRSAFRIEEFTVETNPYTNKETRFAGYAALGVDRVTLGAQSLCERTLSFLGRKHGPADVRASLAAARAAGIAKVQVDLIYGLRKGLRGLSLRDEVRALADAGATGISAYAITIESRTALGKSDANAADDEMAADEYLELLDACAEGGFRQVETSNFSAFEAKHNNIYWYGLPYLGVGTGAHGLLPPDIDSPYGRRYRTGTTPAERAPGDDDLRFEDATARDALFRIEEDAPRDAGGFLDEAIFTLLRTPTGLPDAFLETCTSTESLARLREDARIRRGLDAGLLTWDGSLKVAPKEKIRGDAWCAIVSSLLEPANRALTEVTSSSPGGATRSAVRSPGM